ncbi:MAG: ExeA family protein [Ktedonobacteraceae bacterium]
MKDAFLEYFGMTKTPFGKDLSRRDLFNYPQLAELEEIIRLTVKDRAMSLVTGRSGSGKTTGTRAALEELPHQQYKIIYLGQDRTTASFFARLADALGLRPEISRCYRSLHISKRLENEVTAGGREVVLLVDEVHLLDRAALEELRLLSNSEMDRRSLVSIILLGQIWIRDRLRYREYEALNQRLRLRYALEGLTEKETAQYILHHLSLVGCKKELFTADAVKQVFLAAGGLPRQINNICFASLVKAKSCGKKTIDVALVKRVVQEQEVL